MKKNEAVLTSENQVLSERDNTIKLLEQQVSSLRAEVENKNIALNQLNNSAIQFGYRLKLLRESFLWKLLGPVRAVFNVISGLVQGVKVGLHPLHHLVFKDGSWHAHGNDPQFLLIAERSWQNFAGWYLLEFNFSSDVPVHAQIFFDTGHGFNGAAVLDFQIDKPGKQRIPIFIPANCKAIRFDPDIKPGRFKIKWICVKRPHGIANLSGEFLAQANVYEALGGREGNIGTITPVHGLALNEGGKYCWRSIHNDPWFKFDDFCRKMRLGWYLIEVRITSNITKGNAKFYYDYGDGYSEANSVEVPFNNGRLKKRLYRFSKLPKAVRFDPIDSQAQFSVKLIRFKKVSALSAYHGMLKRFRNHTIQYKAQSYVKVFLEVTQKAKKQKIPVTKLLWDFYNGTFVSNGLGDYSDWIISVETPEFSDVKTILKNQTEFKMKPLISVIMPAYNTSVVFLRLAIESVLQQSYPNWELCIADDASPNKNVRKVIDEYVKKDRRIKAVYRKKNGHISEASNSALELANGDFIALLDHDDELSPHALHYVVEAINRNPSAQIIYSDEDKIDETGYRSGPHFKTDWNPELFFSQNYVSHLGVYDRKVISAIKGFRTGVEGSQDHDLLLRCLPCVEPQNIVHIPKVLYHWRMLEGSTALAANEKNYTSDASIKALKDYFENQGQQGVKVLPGLAPNTYRIRYPIPDPAPLVSLLIPTRDMLEVLKPCVDSIINKSTYKNFEIVILDNESIQAETLSYFEYLKLNVPQVKIVPYHFPFNYSAINNFGVEYSNGEIIGLINNDVEVISPEWLEEMVRHVCRPEIGCVGAKLYYDDDTIQHAGVITGLGGVAGHSHKYFPRHAEGYFHRLKIVQNLSAVTAACLLVRKDVFMQVKGLDEEKLQVAFNDVDFCLKVREAGYRNLWTPYAELYHHESKSRGAEDTPEKVERFNREVNFMKTKWGKLLDADPYYNRNLTLAKEDFSI